MDASAIPCVEVQTELERDRRPGHEVPRTLTGPNPSQRPERTEIEDDGVCGVEDSGSGKVPIGDQGLDVWLSGQLDRAQRRPLHELDRCSEFLSHTDRPIHAVPNLPPLVHQGYGRRSRTLAHP